MTERIEDQSYLVEINSESTKEMKQLIAVLKSLLKISNQAK
jgi:hypothetical protein